MPKSVVVAVMRGAFIYSVNFLYRFKTGKNKLIIIMKTTLWLLLSLFFIIYSSKPTIGFKPFSIEFGSPYTPFGILFLILALSCFDLQSRKNGKLEALEKYYRIGFKDGSEFTVDQLNKKLKEQGKDVEVSIKRDVE